ncbi:MAG: D-alanyl-lipoteichoic acid biosynthesis protein DltB [Firmicutes bacterium]|nr:D-alanyl-lipoteichoic acid biosynthesis protein DltB [Bacillota bacterium]
MTLLGEAYFFIWLIVLAIPAIWLGINEKSTKIYGLITSGIFAAFAIGSDYKAAIYLVSFCVFQLFLAKILIKQIERKGRKRALFWIFVILSILPLCIYKLTAFFDISMLGFIGISYLTFKSAQVVIEIYDGLITEIKPLDYLYFLIFFPCLSSGPIDRSRRFEEDINKILPREEYLENLGTGIMYIFMGAVYKFCFAALLYQGFSFIDTYNQWWSTLVYMYAYGFYLFFDFAGYSKMAVGISYVFGVKTPENFDKPFISIDMKDFWNRWHITLSHWFRDFLFSRFIMASIRGKWFNDRLVGASIGFVINMLVMGIWHGIGWSYILYGLYHGILLAATEIYQKKSKFYKKYKKNRLYKAISWFITLNLVMFGFLIFSGKVI